MAVPVDNLYNLNWEKILLASNSQTGGNIVGFSGIPYQRGYGIGSFLGSLFRLVAPIAKKVVRNIAREGLSTAVSLGSDVLQGQDPKESFKKHFKMSASRLVKRSSRAIRKKIQAGGSLGEKE